MFYSIGEDVVIQPTAIIKRPELVQIGSHVAIDDFVLISCGAMIGSYVHIAPMCSVIGGKDGRFYIDDFASMSAGCRIITVSDDFMGDGLTNPMIPERYRAAIINNPVILEKHVILGTNTVVMPGVRMGEGSATGAGAVVTHDTEPGWLYLGIPARKVKKRPADFAWLEEQLRAHG